MASLMVTVAAEELDAGCGSSVRVKAMAEEVVPLACGLMLCSSADVHVWQRIRIKLWSIEEVLEGWDDRVAVMMATWSEVDCTWQSTVTWRNRAACPLGLDKVYLPYEVN